MLKSLILIFFTFCLTTSSLAQLTKAEEYNRVDNIIYRYKKTEGLTFDSIVKRISRIEGEEMKIRAFYSWIALNVAYDTDMLQQLEQQKMWNYRARSAEISQQADTVFARKKAVCEGFSKLFKKFCDSIHVPCEMVIGYPKMPDGEVITGILHAWNAVKINGKWQLLDITWSNGYLNSHNQYIKRFSDKYFFTRPDVFLEDHLPLDPMWQLEEHPVNKAYYFASNTDTSKRNTFPFFAFNDSIAKYELLDKEDKMLTDYLHYHRFDSTEKRFALNIDYLLLQKAGGYVFSANAWHEDYIEIYNSTLPRGKPMNDEKKTKDVLRKAKENYDIAFKIMSENTYLHPDNKTIWQTNLDNLKISRARAQEDSEFVQRYFNTPKARRPYLHR